MSQPKTTLRPTHDVYVVDGEGDKAFWTKIGAAWQHPDGDGLNMTLHAVPLNGRIVIRSAKATETRNRKGRS
ncbi:hypothetical protein [Agrobacterium bohemicum]|uniref:Uncharacterized protein n=1 Tax=Agrobacterium bohemicum TaxID=2052828 RepID=A0A135P849_9HYPH|nr:hypothetical protein [Agrobacterium bohemicum]KXG87599.1 hypothetical protein ATO67_18300 [Agrobacterium bohemicum]